MVIGLDYHNTITRNEELFTNMATAWLASGFEVFIVSALKSGVDIHKVYEREDCSVPRTGIEIVYFDDFAQIPELKLELCKRLCVDIIYDDMPEVIKLCQENGILTCLVK